MPPADTYDIQELFQQYLEVCNKAMEANGERFPYKHLWEAAEKLQDPAGMCLTVYDDEPKCHYQLKIHDKHLEVTDQASAWPDESWGVKTSYLRHVVANPDTYINEPQKLDWHWLKKPAG
jgi:hypothetical protein